MSTAPDPQGITDPPIDELLDKPDSKYSLVIYAAKRARQINAYYSQLGEGLLEYVGPLVETQLQEKPLPLAGAGGECGGSSAGLAGGWSGGSCAPFTPRSA